jgi:transcriptional regulator with XRE-family HTH domain
MEPMGLTQGALAKAMGVQRKHVNELCNDRRNVTAATALISRLRVRQQCGFLAQTAAAKRPLESDALAARAQTDRTRAASDGSGMNPSLLLG